jgi:hypothetical protein
LAWGRLQKIPPAAPRVGEDGDHAVRFVSRTLQKAHAARAHRRVLAVEIVGF